MRTGQASTRRWRIGDGSWALMPLVAAAMLANCGNSGSGEVAAAGSATSEAWKEFSGQRAFAHVQAMVALGPRPSGSEALERTREYIGQALQAAGWEVRRQEFEDRTPRGPVRFANLRARFSGSGGGDPWARGVESLVASHYDTKLFDDVAFVGANDAGSSTGLLLELARAAAAYPDFAKRLELVFFDGEEAVVQYTATDGLYGSRYYARQLRYVERALWPRFMVLFDMVGDRDLRIGFPSNGSTRLRLAAFAAAGELGFGDYFGLYPGEILDDHVPLAGMGLEVTNFMDFSYAPWHTPEDTLDKVSAESLEIVGRTGLRMLERHMPQ